MARPKKQPEQEETLQKVFKVKLNLTSGVGGIDRYLEETAETFLEFNITLLTLMVESLERQAGGTVDSLFRISRQDDPDVPLLKGEKSEEIFEELMDMVDKIKKAKELIDESKVTLEQVSQKVDDVTVKNGEERLKVSRNIFEEIQKSMRGN